MRYMNVFILLVLLTFSIAFSAQKGKKGSVIKPKVTVVTPQKEEPTTKSVETVPVDSQQTQPPLLREPAAGEQIDWHVLASGGGTKQTVGAFILGSTIGQTAIGWTTTGGNNIHSGFWQDFSDEYCCQNRGNVDGVIGSFGPVDVADATYLVAVLWQGGADPPCIEEGNVDGVMGSFGPIDVADLTYLVAFLWQGGADPPPCP